MSIEADRQWLQITEGLIINHNIPLTAAHNQVLALDYILATERRFDDDSNVDEQIAESMASDITRNLNLGTPLSGGVYIPFVVRLKAEAYFNLASVHEQAFPENIEIATNFIQTNGTKNRESMQRLLESRFFQTLSYKYIDLITPMIMNHQVESHFNDIDHIPLDIAVQQTGLSKSRISRLSTEGKVSRIKPGGYILFVSLSDIYSYLDQRVQGGIGIKATEEFQLDETKYHLVNTINQRFGVTENWISTLIRRGIVDGVQPEQYRGRWYVNLDSLKKYFENNKNDIIPP